MSFLTGDLAADKVAPLRRRSPPGGDFRLRKAKGLLMQRNAHENEITTARSKFQEPSKLGCAQAPFSVQFLYKLRTRLIPSVPSRKGYLSWSRALLS